ncbi:MAG: HPr family phosphocarrier protein [Lachnospiraceae bacterium]|nr:HPr family phosphocarrier protein [Lachnospiraceae bacterium]MCH4070930.1 HPr family phosphocarrier protein [Lachnospiraceae bacterium]MCH4107920.1 HPr family phosphocarrier protein [Lachnospiraceae bacterium]MCI1332257.1 HPr family phosphocarrier protein [Lachnospiraceae bacterium]MCI1361626.1 HPr family phosphocarrier protein [Lachnospiraceae bacterium]
MMNEENVLTYTVTLHDAKQAVKFVEIVNGLTGHFDLRAGNYSFDAKSLLGVLSMDPGRTMMLTATGADRNETEKALSDFILSEIHQSA